MTAAPRPQAEIPSVKGLLVLDGDGKRIVARYYSSHFASSTDELAFEKKLFDKTARTNAKSDAEIIILDGLVTVYRNSGDVWFYVVGSQTENELILVNMLSALHEALSSLLRAPPDKRLLLEPFLNMEVASLVRCHGHPHIMQLLAVYDVPANDVGPDGEWHLVMELAEGGELFERLLNHGAAASAEEERASRRQRPRRGLSALV